MKNMIKNLFFHFGAPILVAAYWVLVVIFGLVAHYQLGIIAPVIVFGAILPLGIGAMLIIGIPEIQSYIKCSINEMNQE